MSTISANILEAKEDVKVLKKEVKVLKGENISLRKAMDLTVKALYTSIYAIQSPKDSVAQKAYLEMFNDVFEKMQAVVNKDKKKQLAWNDKFLTELNSYVEKEKLKLKK